MNCTRCQGTGFLNIEQVPTCVADHGAEAVLEWLLDRNRKIAEVGGCFCAATYAPCQYCTDWAHDVQICDCCGNGNDAWHGEPGQHCGSQDQPGRNGPYAYNGGLCECH